MSSSQHFALLGKSPDLAAAELEAVATAFQSKISPFKPPYFYLIQGKADPTALIKYLGGTVKIYKALYADPASVLIEAQQTHFCLSSITKSVDLTAAAKQIKTALRQANLKPHFQILPDPFYSAGVMDKYTEFTYLPQTQPQVIAQAIAVQNLNYWTQKDYGRPAFDASSGMLPPKVARMMLNLSLVSPRQSATIYDPMCGSGTILVEGLDLNHRMIGSDLSPKAITVSTQNTNWFIYKYKPQGQIKLFAADATHVQLNEIGKQVDAIVFEGYLGPPHPQEDNVPNLIKGLEKLYKGIFKNLYSLLVPGGKIVCALPEYHTHSGVKNLDHLVDWTSTLGYTRHGRFTYGRTHAFTKRAIYVLQKTVS